MRMRQIRFFVFFSLGLLLTTSFLYAQTRRIEANGEVTSVDPFYSSVTLKHGAIKNFAGDGETAFAVDSTLLKNINVRDLVDFTIVDEKGDVRLEKITKTGVAEPEKEAKMGQVLQEVLVGTGEVAKGITTPIEPAHQVVSGTVDATTGATGSLLSDADNKVKTKF